MYVHLNAGINGCYVHIMATNDSASMRFEMRTPKGWLDRIDAWRQTEPDFPSRAKAIRRLVEVGLQKEAKHEAE
jgi:hypothetical protein